MAALHFIAGKAGAGKTTLARQLAQSLPAVVICEDEWLSNLTDPIDTLAQYLAASRRIRSVIAPLATELLRLGTSVVFDFAGNTRTDRLWVRSIITSAASSHVLHVIQADDALCLARVQQRNITQPSGVYFGVVTEQQVDEVNRHFELPDADEGFVVVMHAAEMI